MAPTGLLQSFVAAIQANMSVLLVMSYGGVAAHLGLMDRASTKPISRLSARMLLPALLVTKVGSELHAGSAHRYLVILAWALACHVVSFLVGAAARRGLGMPDWATVAILINNTTSYPLLLITALEDTGILHSLIVTDETVKDAIERAKSYFLVFSTVSNCITFAVGPRLIESEDAPDHEESNKAGTAHGDSRPGVQTPDVEANEETRLLHTPLPSSPDSAFLPRYLRQDRPKPEPEPDDRRPWFVPRPRWDRLAPRTKWWLHFAVDFFNAPLVGAVIGAVLGLVPVFHRAFFNSTEEGGIFTAWLTESLKSIGGLFVTLPVVVAGISLFCSSREARQNHESVVSMPWATVSFILFVRFVAWPALSITTIYTLATKTTMLGSDPILWFALMMMPTGPSAMKLITLVQVADGSKDDEVHITRLLTVGGISGLCASKRSDAAYRFPT